MVLLDISSWWQGMDFFAQIFWSIALLFSLLFLIQMVVSFVGGDGDAASGDADDYVSGDDGIGYQFFTIRNMIAFFAFFGWAGVAGISGGLHRGLTILIALLAGSVVVAMMAFLFRSMSKLKQSGTLQIKNAIGLVAETYLFIPASRGGFGKVHIKVQGSLHELQAITDDAEQIATGRLVKVTGIINDSVLVVTSSLS
jgi:uncharacterized membrane protein